MCTLYITIQLYLHKWRKQFRNWLFRLGCIFHPSWHYSNHSSICTTDKILRIGNIYAYKESGFVDIVRLLDVFEDEQYIYCTLYFFEENKIITVDQRLNPDDYIIWRIMDNEEFDEIMSSRLWQDVNRDVDLIDFD